MAAAVGWPALGAGGAARRGDGGGAAAVVARLVPGLLLIASEAIRKRASSPMQDTRAAIGKDRHMKANEM